MPAEKWELLRQEYGRVGGELDFVPQPTVSIKDLTIKDLKRIKKDAEDAERQQELDQLFYFAHSIQAEFYGSGSFATPVPNHVYHENKAKTLTVHDLKSKIENIALKIEKVNETIKLLQDAVLNTEVKEKAERIGRVTITYQYLGSSNSNTITGFEYNKLAALTEQKIECLKEVIQFHRKIKRVYENELKRRTIGKNELTGILKKAEELCRQAEKCREKIVKANEKAAESDHPDFKTASDFVENFEKFHNLQGLHHNLINKTRFLTDQPLNFPTFPRELTIDETTKKALLKRVYKKEKMRVAREKLRER